MNKIKLGLTLASFLIISYSSLEAGDRVNNGGSGEEISLVTAEYTLKSTVDKIFYFFATKPAAKLDFPEVNFEKLMSIKNHLKIEVTEEDLIDREGRERDCLNGVLQNQNILKCRYSYIKRYFHDPYNMFVLSFHELLGITGDEISSIYNNSLMQSYPISSRLAKYVISVNDYDLSLGVEAERKIKKDIGNRAICSNSVMDAGMEQFCKTGRPRTHINRIEFYYADTYATNYAYRSHGLILSGQMYKACAGGDERYCRNKGDGYFSRIRTMTLDSDISLSLFGNARNKISVNDISLSLLEAGFASGEGPAVSTDPFLGADRIVVNAQVLKISYRNGNRSQILGVQIPFTILDLASELQYKLTDDGALKVFIRGAIDFSLGQSEIIKASNYQKFNISSHLSTEAGIIFMDQVTLKAIGQYALNSNIIDKENLYGANIIVHLFDWLDMSSSYTRKDIAITGDFPQTKKQENVHQFVFGLSGQF
jgi:hypothetical protein